MNYSVNRKNLLWLGIVSAIGAAGSLFSNIFIFAEDYLRHPVFHSLVFLTDIAFSVFLYSPFIFLAVYILFFARKKLDHGLLSVSCILLLISSLCILVVSCAPFIWGYEELLNVIVPLETIEDLVISGNVYAFWSDFRITFCFYESLFSIIFSAYAIVSVRKNFKKIIFLRGLSIVLIVLNILFTLSTLLFGIDELNYGNPVYLINAFFDSVATVSFFLFWLIGIKKADNTPEQTDTKTELKKAKYLLEIGFISQEEFERKKEKILEQN